MAKSVWHVTAPARSLKTYIISWRLPSQLAALTLIDLAPLLTKGSIQEGKEAAQKGEGSVLCDEGLVWRGT